jgi:hypothetical protein
MSVLSWRAGLCLRDKRWLRPDLALRRTKRLTGGRPLACLYHSEPLPKRIGRRASGGEGQGGERRGGAGNVVWWC